MGLLYVVFVYSNARNVSAKSYGSHTILLIWLRPLYGGWRAPRNHSVREEEGLINTVVLVPTEAGSQL